MSPTSRPTCARTFARCTAIAAVLALVVLESACVDFTGGRFDRQESLESVRFGDEQLVSARIHPGRVRALDQQPGVRTIAFWSSAPWPAISINNGSSREERLLLRIENASPTAVPAATLGPLAPGAPVSPFCADLAAANDGQPAPSIEVAPPDEQDISGNFRVFEVRSPPCARLEIRLELPPDQERLRLAIGGDYGRSGAGLDALFSDAVEASADAIILIGNFYSRGDEPWSRVLELRAESGLPLILIPGYREEETSLIGFQDRFGPTTWTTRAGRVRLLSLDTGAPTLSSSIFGYLSGLSAADRGGFALMSRSLLPINRATGRALDSTQQGQRATELLATAGYRTAWVSEGRTSGSAEFGSVSVDNVSWRGRGHWLLVDIDDPWERDACADGCTNVERLEVERR